MIQQIWLISFLTDYLTSASAPLLSSLSLKYADLLISFIAAGWLIGTATACLTYSYGSRGRWEGPGLHGGATDLVHASLYWWASILPPPSQSHPFPPCNLPNLLCPIRQYTLSSPSPPYQSSDAVHCTTHHIITQSYTLTNTLTNGLNKSDLLKRPDPSYIIYRWHARIGM